MGWVCISSLSLLPIFTSCKSEESSPQGDCNNSDLAIQLTDQKDTECSLANGEVTFAASGGSGDYTYKLGSRNFQEDPVFSELSAGNYTVTVKDASNCEANAEIAIRNNDGVNMEVSFTTAGCTEDEGSITIISSDGKEPYLYKIGEESFQQENVFHGLPQGSYTVVTKDAINCEVSQEVRILSGTLYSATVSPIIETNCAVSGCHSGSQAPDLRNFDNIQANASSIKSAVVSGRMPKEGSLTQSEIDAIACWVDDGAPNN